MVYLSPIYTKSGDRGDTGLGDGSRVPKKIFSG
jgi:cob(I)alamin adenosyltransferase